MNVKIISYYFSWFSHIIYSGGSRADYMPKFTSTGAFVAQRAFPPDLIITSGLHFHSGEPDNFIIRNRETTFSLLFLFAILFAIFISYPTYQYADGSEYQHTQKTHGAPPFMAHEEGIEPTTVALTGHSSAN